MTETPLGRDWRPEIVELVQLKQAVADADTQGLWEFHLPRVAASEQQIVAAEARLGVKLQPGYRSFLQYADGWPPWFQSVDLFGTDDLQGSGRWIIAVDLIPALDKAVAVALGGPEGLVPIAATTVDLDLFVMRNVNGQLMPPVVWLAGDEIDRFDSFEQYVRSMIEYNRRELEALRTPPPQTR